MIKGLPRKAFLALVLAVGFPFGNPEFEERDWPDGRVTDRRSDKE